MIKSYFAIELANDSETILHKDLLIMNKNADVENFLIYIEYAPTKLRKK